MTKLVGDLGVHDRDNGGIGWFWNSIELGSKQAATVKTRDLIVSPSSALPGLYSTETGMLLKRGTMLDSTTAM